jgi:hypothetical protein
MAKVDVIQTSFTAGEFGPSLFGRTDIVQYANACAIVENFLPRSYGPVISMPGTTYVRTVSNSTLATRLIKFVFNRSDAYAIEMGKNYFRFYTNGGIVVTTGTTPFVLAHVYDETEIFDVQYTQVNDVIYLFHPDHPIQKLIRRSAASWTIADAPIVGGPFLDENTPALTSSNVSAATTTITPSATAGTINITVSPTNASLFTLSTSTLGHHGAYWMIGGLSQTNATTGLQEIGYVRITHVINSYTATATVIKNLKVATATTVWAEGAWSAVRGYPARGTFHERRLFAARTDFEPQKEWGSDVFVYEDFSLNTEADDDGLNLPLASNESNEIQWLASGKSLIAGTFGGAFVTNSRSTDPITPDNATASEEIGYGSADVVPRKIGNFLYFVQRFGTKLREMFYNFDTDTYKAVDRTILSPHILGDGVVDMDVQQNPESVLYCVLTSGTLATMTREIDQEVAAWARHTTSGTYCSVAVIPSQTNLYDEVWVIVQRWINGVEKRYVELFDSIEVPDRQDMCNYLHSSLRYNAYATGSTSTLTLTVSTTASSGTISVSASGGVFVAGDVGKRIRMIDALGATIGEGEITSRTSSTVVNIAVTYTISTLSFAASRWGISVESISGLDHLESETVAVLADGGTDKPDKTVSSGTITLADDYFVVNVGLPYDQIIKTLPKEAGSQRGTSQGKKQRINEVAFKLNRSHKGFKVGRDADNVDQVGTRNPSTPLDTPEPLFTGVLPNDESGAAHSFAGDWEYGSEVYLINEDPLPVELLAIIINLETIDK